jgi:prepilin-type N-terminal cleavage/methylation domain-containing protein
MRTRGFTLVELMAVVTMIALMAVLAVTSFRRSRTENDVDGFTNAIRTAMIQARRRAVATRFVNPYGYLVDVQPTSVRWCQVDRDTVDKNTFTTTQVSCTPPPAGLEAGDLVWAGRDAQVSYFAPQADVQSLSGDNLVAASSALAPSYVEAVKQPMPSKGTPLYFGPSGVCDASFNRAYLANQPLTGFTYYVQPITTTADSGFRHRKISLYGISARPRIIDKW